MAKAKTRQPKTAPRRRRKTAAITKRFATLRDARSSKDGRAAIDMAEAMFLERSDLECRQWVRTALSCDKAGADSAIADLIKWRENLESRDSELDELDELTVVDNVTSIGATS